VPALVELLTSTKTDVALATIDTLIALGEAAHDRLIDRLSDSNWLVRRRAALVLAQTAPRAVAQRLVMRAAEQPDPVMRRAAITGIGRFPADGAAGILADFLSRDPDVEVRIAAATALGAVPDVAAKEALGRALGDPEFPVRLAARKSLATIVK
jgi:HEAT repeat protein